jgi:chemotaxis protein CheD
MVKRFNAKLNLPMVTIQPGEYYLTRRDEVIATVLGSCISVCLRDHKNQVGGMNHFLLPGNDGSKARPDHRNPRYGRYAMELILYQMIKLGSRRRNLTAQVYGGGHVLQSVPMGAETVPQANIEFTMSFLNSQGIRVVESDVGGRMGREVQYLPRSGKVYLRYLKELIPNKH